MDEKLQHMLEDMAQAARLWLTNGREEDRSSL
jgi:hypothetical protein